MSRQEQTVKKQRAASTKAQQIIEEAYARVKANSEAVVDGSKWQKPEALDDSTWHLACAVRTQRDAGVPWWQIAHALSLPGSADNVAQGKSGASFARKVYKAGFGDVPRVQRTRVAGKPVDPNMKAVKATPKAERVQMVRAGKPVIPESLEDGEVVEMLRGRHISWTTNMNNLDGKGDLFTEHEADVHHIILRIENHGGERCIAFKERNVRGPVKIRALSGKTRVVALRWIHGVR